MRFYFRSESRSGSSEEDSSDDDKYVKSKGRRTRATNESSNDSSDEDKSESEDEDQDVKNAKEVGRSSEESENEDHDEEDDDDDSDDNKCVKSKSHQSHSTDECSNSGSNESKSESDEEDQDVKNAKEAGTSNDESENEDHDDDNDSDDNKCSKSKRQRSHSTEDSSNDSSNESKSESNDEDEELKNAIDTATHSDESENQDHDDEEDEDDESGDGKCFNSRSRRSRSTEDSSNDSSNESQSESNDEDEELEKAIDTATHSDELENEDDSEDGNGSDDERPTDRMAMALAVAEGKEVPLEHFREIQRAADELDDDLERLHVKYILCAHAAHHSGFIEPDYFGNLPELLSTDNVIIRKSIMWAFASILPCKNVLSPLLIRLLYKSLRDKTLGWSISYLFRKMTEYDKYIPMVADGMWVSMASLLFDAQLSEQVRTTIVQTLSNVYKIHKWVSPVIKCKFEQFLQTEGIPTRILVAIVHGLHSMAISGANLETETKSRLRHLASTGNATSMESVYDLLDFLENKRVLSNAAGSLAGSSVKKELTATQNTSVSRSEEESVEPTVKIHSMDHLLSTVGHLGRTFNAESRPNDVREGNNQAWYRTTKAEVSNLVTLAKQGTLKAQDFDYLEGKFHDGLHWSTTPWRSREEIFEMIADAFQDAAKAQQAIPQNVLNVMIDRLSGTNDTIHRRCAEALLRFVENQQALTEQQVERIESKLKQTSDIEVKQHLIELCALYVAKGYHFKLDLAIQSKAIY